MYYLVRRSMNSTVAICPASLCNADQPIQWWTAMLHICFNYLFIFLQLNYFINQSECMWDGNWREKLNFKLGHIHSITKVEHTKNQSLLSMHYYPSKRKTFYQRCKNIFSKHFIRSYLRTPFICFHNILPIYFVWTSNIFST